MSNYINCLLQHFYGLLVTVNPFVIAEWLGIEVRYEDLGSRDGYYNTILGDQVIIINYRLRDSNKRFVVCAHELFHAIQHHDIASYYTVGDRQRGKLEYESNEFACQLICNLYVEDFGELPKSFDVLKNYYGLPESSRNYFFIE